MQTELDFDRPHNSTPTSIAAADSQSPKKAAIDRERILMFVHESGGATRDEIEVGTGIIGNTVRPRVHELIAQQFRLVEVNRVRPTRTGRDAFVLMSSWF